MLSDRTASTKGDILVVKVKAFSVGGVDYITQPIQAQEVIARVENQLTLARQKQQLQEQTARLEIEARERQQAEAAVRQLEERWQMALKGNNDGIWDWNIITGEVFFSSRWKEMLGHEDYELKNNYETWAKRIHPDDVDRVVATLNAYQERRIPHYAIEHRLRCKDGSYKWILGRGQAVWNEQGQVVRMVGSNTDISDRKHNAAAIGSDDTTLALLAQIPQEYTSLAQVLTKLANNFQFGKIIELIQHNITGIIEA